MGGNRNRDAFAQEQKISSGTGPALVGNFLNLPVLWFNFAALISDMLPDTPRRERNARTGHRHAVLRASHPFFCLAVAGKILESVRCFDGHYEYRESRWWGERFVHVHCACPYELRGSPEINPKTEAHCYTLQQWN